MTVNPDIKFYDTSSLLLRANNLFDDEDYRETSLIIIRKQKIERVRVCLILYNESK